MRKVVPLVIIPLHKVVLTCWCTKSFRLSTWRKDLFQQSPNCIDTRTYLHINMLLSNHHVVPLFHPPCLSVSEPRVTFFLLLGMPPIPLSLLPYELKVPFFLLTNKPLGLIPVTSMRPCTSFFLRPGHKLTSSLDWKFFIIWDKSLFIWAKCLMSWVKL